MTTLTPAELAAAFKDAPTGIYQRKIERTVILHELPDGSKTAAVMSTRHDLDSKQFSCSIRIVKHEPRDGSAYSVTTWIPFERTHNKRLPSIPVARYSDKALNAADTENIDLLTAEPDWLDSLDLGPYQGTL